MGREPLPLHYVVEVEQQKGPGHCTSSEAKTNQNINKGIGIVFLQGT